MLYYTWTWCHYTLLHLTPCTIRLRVIACSNVQTPMKIYRDHKQSGKHDPPNKYKEMEVQKLPEKEFKIFVLKMLRDLQENANTNLKKKSVKI